MVGCFSRLVIATVLLVYIRRMCGDKPDDQGSCGRQELVHPVDRDVTRMPF